MRVSEKAIVLQAIRYGDKKYILKLFTRQHGLISAVCVSGKNAKVKTSAILPLSLIDAEILSKQNKDVQQLTEAACYYIPANITTSLSRLSIAQFINEVLLKTIKEQTSNESLFNFTESCLKYLDQSEEYLNLHLYFLLELTRYMGFEPSDNYSETDCYFDCREGRFTSNSLAFPLGLDKEDSKLLSGVLKANLLDEKIGNTTRAKLLNIFSAYYQFHVPGFNQLRSLEILKEVVNA